tara:strand:- start:235 stop:849 length:615 start_codon:yes stop_codon:yes gene_type:complete
MIVIIDYGAGNIKSIVNMLKRIGVPSIISNQPNEIARADKLILPGVGHFGHGMRNLQNTGLLEVIEEKVLQEKVPILGICLGAQMLGKGSEEAVESGLGWIDMEVKMFDKEKMDNNLKIPHMGWNEIKGKKASKLLNDTAENARFYFVHTYHMVTDKSDIVLAESNYGYSFVAAVEYENIYGVQFHPEKSHKYGMNLLQQFSIV